MMKLRKLLGKRRSIFISWLLSYFMIIVVCIFISTALYFRAEKLIEAEVNSASGALLQQVQQSADSRLKEIVMLANQISLDKNVMGMFYVKEPQTPNDRLAALQIVNSFSASRNANTFIKCFYVFFSRSQSVIGWDGVYDRETLFDTVHRNDNISFAGWESMMQETHRGEFIPLYDDDVGFGGKEQRTVAYLKSLLINDASTKVTLAVAFDQFKLLEAVKNPNVDGKGAVLVINGQNQTIASSEEEWGDLPDYDALAGDRGLVYLKLGNQNMAVSYQKSEINDWKYVSVMPVSEYKEKVDDMRRLTYLGMGACLILGGIIAFFAARRNYHPVKAMMGFVAQARDREGPDMPRDTDEFSFIQDFIQSTLTEKEEYYQDWKRHSAELKAAFLQRLLKGEVEEELSSGGVADSYGIRFASEQFAVLLFCMEDFTRLFSGNKDKARQVSEFLISNVAEELSNQQCLGWIIKAEDMIACLINFRSEDAKRNREELSRIAGESKSFLEEKLRVDVTIAKSNIHTGAAFIPLAYKETLEAMDYRMVFGSGIIIPYSDIKPVPLTYSYTMLTEQRLINSIKAGDYDQARQIVDTIFAENFSTNILSLEMTRCFMFSLVNTMMKALEEISMLLDHRFLEDIEPVDRLLKSKSLSAMKAELDMILRQICDHIREVQKKSRNDDLRDAIISYIGEHYRDVNLGVAGIAEAFRLNAIQMSKFFREQNGGETLPDYINRYRIQKAKLLLEHKDHSIYSIAEEVGYSNANTFIRAYKKYEGITPGKFREMTRGN